MSTPIANSTNRMVSQTRSVPQLRTAGANAQVRLAWLLDDLALDGVRFAVLLSEDGLRIAHSGTITTDDAERFAAAACGLRSLGKVLGEFCGGLANTVRQNMTEYDEGMVLITAAGAGTLLGVATTPTVDLALVAHRMNELAARVGHELGASPRHRSSNQEYAL